MSAKIYDNIEIRAQKALDSRSIVTYKEQLYRLETWPHDLDENGNPVIYMKEGMQVMVTGTKDQPVFDLYILTDLDKILNEDYSGWKLYSSGGMSNIGANLDGGRADERYAPHQVLDFGHINGASVRGETND